MRKIRVLLTIILASSGFISEGQSSELSWKINSGIFGYRGKSSVGSTKIDYNDQKNPDSWEAENYLGYQPGLYQSLSFRFKRISGKRLLGGSVGVESTNSRATISGVTGKGNIRLSPTDASLLRTSSFGVNASIFLGYRFTDNPYLKQHQTIDLSIRIEAAQALSLKARSKLIDHLGSNSVSKTTLPVFTDYRVRPEIQFYSRSIGVSLYYSLGVRNLMRMLHADRTTSTGYSSSVGLGFTKRLLVGRKSKSCFYRRR